MSKSRVRKLFILAVAFMLMSFTSIVYAAETTATFSEYWKQDASGTWHVYDGVYLDLEASHQGSFAKIKNQDGINALEVKCGLRAVDISNENCVYTSTFKRGGSSSTAPTGSTGGPGGGEQEENSNGTKRNNLDGKVGGYSPVDPEKSKNWVVG